jgi:hypothetical protein
VFVGPESEAFAVEARYAGGSQRAGSSALWVERGDESGSGSGRRG